MLRITHLIPGADRYNPLTQEEVTIRMARSTLVIAVKNEAELLRRVRRMDRVIVSTLKGMGLEQIAFGHSMVLYRVRIQALIESAVRNNVKPQSIFLYCLSSLVDAKVVLFSDESLVSDIFGGRINPGDIVPSGIAFRATNRKDFTFGDRDIALVRGAMTRSVPDITEWLQNFQYGRTPLIDDFLFPSKIYLDELDKWSKVALPNSNQCYKFVTSTYFTDPDVLLVNTENNGIIKGDYICLPDLDPHDMTLRDAPFSMIFAFDNPSWMNPLSANTTYKSQAMLGHLAKTEGLLMALISAECAKRTMAAKLVSALRESTRTFATNPLGPKAPGEPKLLHQMLAPCASSILDEVAKVLLVDIQDIANSVGEPIPGIACGAPRQQETPEFVSWNSLIRNYFQLSYKEMGVVLKGLSSAMGNQSFHDWFSGKITAKPWGNGKSEILVTSASNHSWFKRATSFADRQNAAHMLLHRFTMILTGSLQIADSTLIKGINVSPPKTPRSLNFMDTPHRPQRDRQNFMNAKSSACRKRALEASSSEEEASPTLPKTKKTRIVSNSSPQFRINLSERSIITISDTTVSSRGREQEGLVDTVIRTAETGAASQLISTASPPEMSLIGTPEQLGQLNDQDGI